MKKILNLIVLAILAVFVFNYSYVFAEEQESEKTEGKVEEVLEPVVSDIVNISDNKPEKKEEVKEEAQETREADKSETTSESTTEETKSETEEPKAEETPKEEEPAKEEEPKPTKSVENPELTVKLYDLRISSTEPFKVLTYSSSAAGTTSTKSLGLKDLGVSGIGKNTDNSFKADGYIYTFEGWYTAASGGDKLTTTGITNGNSAVKYIASSDKTRPNGIKVTIGNFEEDITFEIYLNWDKEKLASGKVNVKVTDTRTNNSTTVTTTANEGQSSKDLASMVEGISSDFKIETATTIYTFKGFYTAAANGSLIDTNFVPGEAYPALKTLRSNSSATTPSAYKLFIEALDTFDGEANYEVFIIWDEEEKEVPDYTVTVNVVDKRTGKTTTMTTKPGTGSTKSLSSMSNGIGDNFKVVSGNTTYTFKGIYDAEDGGNKIDASFVPGETYPELKTLYADSDAATPADYKLHVLSADELTSDKTITLYILWDEKERHSVKVTFKVVEQSVSGREITSGNSLPTYDNTIDPNGSWTRTSNALTIKKFHAGNYSYTVDTWYYEDGTPVPAELYVNDDPTRVKFKYVWSEDDPEEITITYILKWNEKKDNKYDIYVYDEISNGDDHTGNANGHQGTITHKFTKLVPVEHYEFLYYKMDDSDVTYPEEYNYFIDVSALGDGVVVKEEFYAWWKADITLILYSDGKELDRNSQFDSIKPSDVLANEPEKIGYRFLGWEDSEGNLYKSSDEFTANDPAKKPEPKEIKLYAKWEQIMIDVKVSKTWDDNNDNDHVRPDEVTVHIKLGDTVVDTAKLSEENNWTCTFNVPEYDGEEKANYSIAEDEVGDYTTEIKTIKENAEYEIINSRDDDTIEVTVTKSWDDEDDADSLRPDYVTVHIVKDGDIIDTAELSEENDWTCTFKVVKNENGSAIEYEITEDEVDGYTTTINGSIEDGFVEVVNYHEAGDMGEGDDGTGVLPPQTGFEDSFMSFFTLLAFIVLLIIKK